MVRTMRADVGRAERPPLQNLSRCGSRPFHDISILDVLNHNFPKYFYVDKIEGSLRGFLFQNCDWNVNRLITINKSHLPRKLWLLGQVWQHRKRDDLLRQNSIHRDFYIVSGDMTLFFQCRFVTRTKIPGLVTLSSRQQRRTVVFTSFGWCVGSSAKIRLKWLQPCKKPLNLS